MSALYECNHCGEEFSHLPLDSSGFCPRCNLGRLIKTREARELDYEPEGENEIEE